MLKELECVGNELENCLRSIQLIKYTAKTEEASSTVLPSCEGKGMEEKEKIKKKIPELLSSASVLQGRLQKRLELKKLSCKMDMQVEKVVSDFWSKMEQAPKQEVKKEPKPTIFGSPGKGPSRLGQVRSVLNTIKTKLKNIFSGTPNVGDLSDLYIKTAVTTLGSEGSQLNDIIFSTCFDIIQRKNSNVSFIRDFYQKKSIEDYSGEEIIRILENNKDINQPICIPLSLGHNRFMERQHITTIVITNDGIQYYDSKGVTSDQYFLKPPPNPQATLRTILDNCKTIFLENKGLTNKSIEENTKIDQCDSHRCGLFVLFFIFSVLLKNKSIEDFKNVKISPSLIDKFRKDLIVDFRAHDKILSEEGALSTQVYRKEKEQVGNQGKTEQPDEEGFIAV